MTILETTTLHREAMELADQAELSRLQGEEDSAKELLKIAFRKEREAALSVAEDHSFEPTRSVLLRSAASLAIECGEAREAERLAARGLVGEPPDQIAEELRDILEQAHFHRHLSLEGLKLAPAELQFSMTGNVIGLGIAKSDVYNERAESIERALFRTAERLLDKPYRDRGRREKALKDRIEIFVSVPRAASFAVTFRLGHSDQIEIAQTGFGERVVDEFLGLMDLFDQRQAQKIRERVPDEAYRRNFLGLAKKIAPDGDAVKMVGFATHRVGGAKQVAVRTTRDEMDAVIEELVESAEVTKAPTSHSPTILEGRLLFADELSESRNMIKIVGSDNVLYPIRVPPGMMADIVSPMWEQKVRVKVTKEKKNLYLLKDIRPVEE